jgi:protein arginine kinase
MGRENKMAWYNEAGEMQDVVISTRVRFARNLENYPFGARLSDKMADDLIDKVSAALPEYGCEKFFDAGDVKLRSYMEMHYVSPEFVTSQRHRALLSGEDGHVKIMLCEEDHVRIQSIVSGFDPNRAFELAGKADDVIGNVLPIAFSEKYGYLTHCPTNLGAAMRVSAMLCLPALSKKELIDRYASALEKMGLTVRGAYGEGSRAGGCIYQISNRASLGTGENEIIKIFSEAVSKLVEAERSARMGVYELNKNALSNAVSRRLGAMKNAYMISSSEVNDGISELKLGISVGIVEGITDEKLAEMMVAVQPATVSMLREGLSGESERDILRASLVRDMMREVSFKYAV